MKSHIYLNLLLLYHNIIIRISWNPERLFPCLNERSKKIIFSRGRGDQRNFVLWWALPVGRWKIMFERVFALRHYFGDAKLAVLLHISVVWRVLHSGVNSTPAASAVRGGAGFETAQNSKRKKTMYHCLDHNRFRFVSLSLKCCIIIIIAAHFFSIHVW